jgi:Membrane transport protein
MMIDETSLHSISSTFVASLRSIGTAVTMALSGYYLHRSGSIGVEGKRTLAVLSQQITFPLFLFSKIIYCNQDWSDEPCPDVTKSLADVWMLLFWPIYVVGVGLLIGWIVAKATNTPKRHVRTVLAACAFGNSTGLPITLLNVIHSNFPKTSDLGRIDPTLFLSVFLLLYPVLQWGLGGFLLTPDEKDVALTNVTSNTGTLIVQPNEKSKSSVTTDTLYATDLTATEHASLISTTSNPETLIAQPKEKQLLSLKIDTVNGTNLLNTEDNNQNHFHRSTHRSSSKLRLSSADEGLYLSDM